MKGKNGSHKGNNEGVNIYDFLFLNGKNALLQSPLG